MFLLLFIFYYLEFYMKKLLMVLLAVTFVASCVKDKPKTEVGKDTKEKSVTKVATTKDGQTNKKNVKSTEKKKKKEIKEEPFILPEILAEIGTEKIKKDEVEAEIKKMEKVYKQFGQKINNRQKQKISRNILNKIIDKKLYLYMLKKITLALMQKR